MWYKTHIISLTNVKITASYDMRIINTKGYKRI